LSGTDEYADVIFCKVDVDEAEDIAKELEINSMPTFKFFRNSKPVGEHVGAMAEMFRSKLESLAKA